MLVWPKDISKYLTRLVCLVVISGILSQCANIISPTGGERDESPPKLIRAESTPNFQTNFKPSSFTLTFDEWVVLEDVFNQVIVSPPLAFRPEVSLKRKSVIFNFDEEEELRTDATYTVNFGTAVKDLTEKNPANNLRFVFATGDILDSLMVKGLIIDARTLEPVEGTLFMLYDNTADSVFTTERPFYFALSDEEGYCTIENVKADTFKVTALMDQNVNYIYDQPNESIGFLNTTIITSNDTSQVIKIFQFSETPIPFLEDEITDQYGVVKLKFNFIPDSLEILNDADLNFIKEVENDTIKLWYRELPEDLWNLNIVLDTLINDTLSIPIPNPETRSSFKALNVVKQKKINPSSPVNFIFNHPIQAFDTALISVLADTNFVPIFPQWNIDSTLQRRLTLNYSWKPGIDYQFEALPGSFTDIFGQTNQDTILTTLSAQLEKEFGTIKLTINNLDSNQNYLIYLLDKGQEKIKTLEVENKVQFETELKMINPGDYRIEIIEDINKNGKWDTGNYELKQQPEPLMIKELEKLRANWDLKVEIPYTPRSLILQERETALDSEN